jgi:hypothetical protein
MENAQRLNSPPYGTPAVENPNIRQIRLNKPDRLTVNSIWKNTKRYYTAWSESSPNRFGLKGLLLAEAVEEVGF